MWATINKINCARISLLYLQQTENIVLIYLIESCINLTLMFWGFFFKNFSGKVKLILHKCIEWQLRQLSNPSQMLQPTIGETSAMKGSEINKYNNDTEILSRAHALNT